MRRILAAPRHALALLAIVLILSLTACQSEELESTPGAADVSPLYTAAAQTLAAQQAAAVPLILVTPTSPAPPPIIVVPSTSVPVTGGAVPVPVTGGGAGATAVPGTCENATFLSDVTIPDGTVVSPGQTFVKTWAVANTGSCPWTTGDRLVLVNGAPMGGGNVPLAGNVAAGETADLSVNLTAPVVAGNYSGTWRLKNAAGNYFGDVVTVVITVGGAADP
jgi:hypothetical protein